MCVLGGRTLQRKALLNIQDKIKKKKKKIIENNIVP